MKRYLTVWWLMTTNYFQTAFANRGGALLFILGKMIRFVFFFLLLVIVVEKTKNLAGYNLIQVIFFFLTFNLVDTAAQFLFREVYRFRPLVVSGDLDLVLVKPINPLLRVLLGGADPLDFVTLIPLTALLVWFGTQLGNVSIFSVLLYFLLVLNALVIATAFHIAVLALGILTTAVDHTIMIYRDLTSMGRIPVDFYNQFIRSLLVFVIPIGVMMTIPAKAFMGLLSIHMILYSFAAGLVLFWASLCLWKWALTRYSSASS